MIENYYEIDKQGNIIGRFKINSLTDTPRPWWVKGNIDGMHEPRYINGEWIDAKSDSELLEELKKAKIDELSRECQKRIIEGFSVDGEHYSYNQDNQINFQDTYQLFLNNMITEILWNAYIHGEKTRVLLDKDKFQRVYLAGVKHKQDCIIHLNDILVPLVESSTNIEVLRAISWGEQKSSFRVSDEKNIAKKVESLSEDSLAQKSINEQVESIVLEIADIAISGF